jgi:hypothetical protein
MLVFLLVMNGKASTETWERDDKLKPTRVAINAIRHEDFIG